MSATVAEQTEPVAPHARMVAWLLVALMAIGSVVMWLAVPAFWLWVASQLSDSSRPSLGPYLLVIVAVPVTMVAIGKGLGWLDRSYGEITHTLPDQKLHAPWLQSMRDERGPQRHDTVLGRVMAISVSFALLVFLLWFLLLAGSPLPT